VGIDFAMGATGRVTLAEFDGVEVSDGFLSISLDPFCAQGQPYDSNATISAIEILEWQPAPIVTSVEPSQGSTLGGTAVTITGQNFQAGAAVRFGGVPAADVVVKAQTEISCKTPAHAAGAVAVEVKNPDGQSASLPDAFTYFIAFLRGDTDGNGQFIINDGIQILERLFAGREAFDSNCEATGDLDDNGQLIINDAIWLFNFLFASGPQPAAPYPKCGPDPTTDDALGDCKYPKEFCPK